MNGCDDYDEAEGQDLQGMFGIHSQCNDDFLVDSTVTASTREA
jgi:hypothetical protein